MVLDLFDVDVFSGKNIMITGAGSGIGRATATLLGGLGANLVLVGRDKEKLNITSKAIASHSVTNISFDLCDYFSYDNLFLQCPHKLDGLVHCAGIAKPIPIKAISVDNVTEIMNNNFMSFVMLVKYFSKRKYSNEGASIVACSAVNVHYPQMCMSIYEASKAAIEGCVRGMAQELYMSRKLRINSMVIGPVATPMAGVEDNEVPNIVGTQSAITPNLMGIASPEYIARMAAFLLSDMSVYSTGRSFFVDGGRF